MGGFCPVRSSFCWLVFQRPHFMPLMLWGRLKGAMSSSLLVPPDVPFADKRRASGGPEGVGQRALPFMGPHAMRHGELPF